MHNRIKELIHLIDTEKDGLKVYGYVSELYNLRVKQHNDEHAWKKCKTLRKVFKEGYAYDL